MSKIVGKCERCTPNGGVLINKQWYALNKKELPKNEWPQEGKTYELEVDEYFIKKITLIENKKEESKDIFDEQIEKREKEQKQNVKQDILFTVNDEELLRLKGLELAIQILKTKNQPITINTALTTAENILKWAKE